MGRQSSLIVGAADRKVAMNTLKSMAGRVARFVQGAGRGQGLAEYALILALIAIIAIVALIFLGGQVSTILSKVGKSI
jgi:Flp pilus assembly pilin Flp